MLTVETRRLDPGGERVTLVYYDGPATQVIAADPMELRRIADALEPFDKSDALRFTVEAEILERGLD